MEGRMRRGYLLYYYLLSPGIHVSPYRISSHTHNHFMSWALDFAQMQITDGDPQVFGRESSYALVTIRVAATSNRSSINRAFNHYINTEIKHKK